MRLILPALLFLMLPSSSNAQEPYRPVAAGECSIIAASLSLGAFVACNNERFMGLLSWREKNDAFAGYLICRKNIETCPAYVVTVLGFQGTPRVVRAGERFRCTSTKIDTADVFHCDLAP